MSKNLLLLSNSRTDEHGYLGHVTPAMREVMGDVSEVLFVPYAGVTITWDAYAGMTRKAFEKMGYRLRSVHQEADPVAAVESAEAIAVGGGNTFHLLTRMNEAGIMGVIRERVSAGMPYTGWSAGSNLACPTICTTNDMPIIQPPSFEALGLVPFQINPHYTDTHPPGHKGETRADRIAEFVEVNPSMTVVGLREGSTLHVQNGEIRLLGNKDVRVFVTGEEPVDYSPDQSLQFLLLS